jgi:putative endonuclease
VEPVRGKDALGRYGEEVAARHLAAAGLVILDRNWRCAVGEIDIVAADGDALVICEVKTRRGTACGGPLEAVTASKLRRLRSLALHWLASRGMHPAQIRFDVVGVLRPERGDAVVTHVKGVI